MLLIKLADVICGWDPKDPTTIKHKLSDSKLNNLDSLKGLTVGIPQEFHCPGLSTEVVQVFFKNVII